MKGASRVERESVSQDICELNDMCKKTRDKMLGCSILNGYEGLNELVQLVREDSSEAVSIAWEVLLSKGDPGKDDYALCSELFQMLGTVSGTSAVANQVQRYWSVLDDEKRLNLLSAIDTGILDLKTIRGIFYVEGNTTLLRHRIVAALAASDFHEAKETIRELVMDIGNYDSTWKQEILNQFKESVTSTD